MTSLTLLLNYSNLKNKQERITPDIFDHDRLLTSQVDESPETKNLQQKRIHIVDLILVHSIELELKPNKIEPYYRNPEKLDQFVTDFNLRISLLPNTYNMKISKIFTVFENII